MILCDKVSGTAMGASVLQLQAHAEVWEEEPEGKLFKPLEHL